MKSRELLLTLQQTRIRAWLYCPDDTFQGLRSTVLFCHGIPGGPTVPGDRGYLDLVEDLVREGYFCVIFNFRGCGLSEGNIDMAGWYEDLSAVSDMVHCLPDIDPSLIHCVAFSAGGAVAAKLASRKKPFRSLLLMATPDDFADILPDDPMLVLHHFLSIGIVRDKAFPPDISSWYNNFLDLKASEYISSISPQPVGIVHGERDETVPPEHARRLFDAACAPKKLIMIEGASHQLRKDPRAVHIIKDWLKENTGRL